MELSDYREKIDSIDKELIKLFAERMDTAAEIARYKKEHGMKVLDSARERAKLNDIASMVPEELSEYAISLYSLIFELSRSSQNRIIGASTPLTEEIARAVKDTPPLFPQRTAVACQGVEGAYSQMACDRLFKRANVLYFSTFEAVFSAIEKGLCQYGVIPVENSTAGSVNAVYDLMMKHDFKIVRSVRLKVDHNLLVNHGTKLEDIKEIYSHEQANAASSLQRSRALRLSPAKTPPPRQKRLPNPAATMLPPFQAGHALSFTGLTALNTACRTWGTITPASYAYQSSLKFTPARTAQAL